VAESATDDAMRAPRSWDDAARAVGSACGMEVLSLCDEVGCVALAETQNLELLMSWWQLATTSLPLVVDVVAHDLGYPAPPTACGRALRALTPTDIRESSPFRGRTYLCATERPFSDSRQLCEALAGNDIFSNRSTKIEIFPSP